MFCFSQFYTESEKQTKHSIAVPVSLNHLILFTFKVISVKKKPRHLVHVVVQRGGGYFVISVNKAKIIGTNKT